MGWVLDPPIYLQAVAVVAGAWRLAVLLVFEAGPFGVFTWLRARIGIDHDADGVPTSWPDGTVAKLFGCVWCMSFWTTLVVYAILWAAPYVVVIFGTWAAATYLEALRPRS